MKNFVSLALAVLCLMPLAMADYSVTITPEKPIFHANEVIALDLGCQTSGTDELWDTYLYFRDSRNVPIYIGVEGNSSVPVALGMFPPQLQLAVANWQNNETVKIVVELCQYQTTKVLASAHATIEVNAVAAATLATGEAQLLLIQEVSEVSPIRSYTDYKQFASQWKAELMGQYNGTTIGASGCAMTSAGNIIGWNPSDLNSHLKDNGGYSGNLLIWGKVPNVSYKGSGSISDSLFASYHVIADVGGHFVLLTGVSTPGKYYSHDPGKSSNPVYATSQIYSVRLYYK